MTQQNEMPKNSSQRHWLYGLNMVVLLIVGVVILVFAFYLTNTYSYRQDITSGGIYSLSESTQKLLGQIDKKPAKYELISLFDPTKETATQVSDLLNEYQRASKNISVKDSGASAREDLELLIKDRYAAELRPYEETVGDFEKLAKELESFAKVEGANFGALAQQAGTSAETKREASQWQLLFGDRLTSGLKSQAAMVERATNSTLPQWGTAVTSLKTFFEQVGPVMSLLADPKQTKEAFSGPVAKYLQENAARYATMNTKIQDYEKRLNALQPLKVQEILDSLRENTIVVLAPESVKVIGRNDIFKFQRSAKEGSDEPTESFEGEQAISSALLSLYEPVKKKVVFVTNSPMQLVSGPFSAVSQRLRDANFDVLEWSPGGGVNPMTGEPERGGDVPPPAEGVSVVWVVMPPEQTNPQMAQFGMPPPPPSPALMGAIKKHLAEGGNVLFLAEATPVNPMSGAPGGFPYAEITDSWGIDVASKYTVVKSVATPDGSVVVPELTFVRFPEHPITRPMQGLPTLFVAGQGRTGYVAAPTVVRIAENKPGDVTASLIIDTKGDKDMWAETEASQDAKFNKETDLAGPVSLGVAASRTVTINGKPVTQHVVVIGSKVFGFSQLVDAEQLEMRSGNLYRVPRFPGNGELFLNSTLWLAGYENMIAVSSKSSVALRIKDISPATLAWIRWTVLYAGAPAAALIAGMIVWAFRRR